MSAINATATMTSMSVKARRRLKVEIIRADKFLRGICDRQLLTCSLSSFTARW
jgi:hypothetical protein